MNNKTDNKIIMVTGSRTFSDAQLANAALSAALTILDAGDGDDIRLLHGAARGADSICRDLAAARGITTTAFEPQWRDDRGRFIRSAGFKRNEQMVNHAIVESSRTPHGKAIVIAMPTCAEDDAGDAKNSVGTWHAVRSACRDIPGSLSDKTLQMPVFIVARVGGAGVLVPHNATARAIASLSADDHAIVIKHRGWAMERAVDTICYPL